MTGTFKPVAFEPFGRRRSSWRLPRSLVMLVLGAAAGAGGVLLVQERLMPPRLSASESTALRTQSAQAQQDRDRARSDLGATTQKLDATVAERKALADELAADRERTKNGRADQDFLIASLPPDPRPGAVEVRAARLIKQRGGLGYEVLLTRSKANGNPPLTGVLQFVVTGLAGGGVERHITLEPVKVNVGSYLSLRGTLALPDAFNPKRTTISVLDRVGGKQLGMRVMYVQ
jgi:hypothetical protein